MGRYMSCMSVPSRAVSSVEVRQLFLIVSGGNWVRLVVLPIKYYIHMPQSAASAERTWKLCARWIIITPIGVDDNECSMRQPS